MKHQRSATSTARSAAGGKVMRTLTCPLLVLSVARQPERSQFVSRFGMSIARIRCRSMAGLARSPACRRRKRNPRERCRVIRRGESGDNSGTIHDGIGRHAAVRNQADGGTVRGSAGKLPAVGTLHGCLISVRSVVQLYPGPFRPAQPAEIERSEAERRKETKSLGGLDGECATGPRSSVSFLLSPFCSMTRG